MQKYPCEHYEYNKMPEQDELIMAPGSGGGVTNGVGNRSTSRIQLDSTNPLHRSISSISEVFYANEDDYFTASDESEEEEDSDESNELSNLNKSMRSAQSSSKQSYFSVKPLQSEKQQHEKTLTNQMSRESTRQLSELEAETKMDLNFDIRRPILDSSLPKYCYLKHLSRAYVQNWNKRSSYPCYEDLSDKNIKFNYRQKGMRYYCCI